MAVDYWWLFLFKLTQAGMGLAAIIVLNVILIPVAILLPQILAIPWKFVVIKFFRKTYKKFVQRRGEIQSFNFHIDLTRASHIHLAEVILCFLILGGGWWAMISVLGSGYLNTLGSLGISIALTGAVWKLWAHPYFTYWKVKSHDVLDIGDMIIFEEHTVLISAMSCAFLSMTLLEKDGSLPAGKRITIEMPIENLFDRYGYFKKIGVASEEVMEALHIFSNYGELRCTPTFFNKQF